MKRNSFLAVVFAASIAFSACSKKDPIPGPQGPAGKDAPFYLDKEGFVKGKIYSTAQNGSDTLLGDFNYEFLYDLESSSYTKGTNGQFNIVRSDTTEESNVFSFECFTSPEGGTPNKDNIYLDFTYVKDLGNGKYLKFGEDYRIERQARVAIRPWNSSTIDVENYSFNSATGKMKFDFIINYDEMETLSGKPARVEGSVDVTLKEEVLLRKGEFNK